ncbi:MAG: PIN domain-containing protein [Nitrospirota bacterium]
MDRVFLDANVLFSAAYRPDTKLRQLFKLRKVRLLSSSYSVEEARRNLATTEQRKDLEELCASLEIITTASLDLPPSLVLDLPASDRPILSAAISAHATHLLTGDVTDFGPYFGQTLEGVLILPPALYLQGHRGGKS